MSLQIGDNFKYLGAKPLDDRRVFASKAAMDAVNLSTVYEGMITYAKAEDKYYRLKGGVWKEFKSGDGGGVSGWTANKAYAADDMITNGGKVYICTTAHTSSAAFATDSAKWKEIGSGEAVTAWATGTSYAVRQMVMDNGHLYICITAHTAGATLAADSAKWLEVQTEDAVTDWAANTAYAKNQLVYRAGKLYLCLTAHTSGTSFADTNWKVISDTPIGDWAANTEYAADTVVVYNDSLFRCKTKHTSAAAFSSDTSKWELVNADIKSWVSGKYYVVGTTAIYNRKLYRCTAAHTSGSSFDSTEKANWEMIGGGSIVTWQASGTYDIGDVVLYNGSIFKCITANNSATFSATNFTPVTADLKAWAASTQYVAGVCVIQDNIIYRCKTAHTSAASFNATEKANWERLCQEKTLEWASGTAYAVGDVITKDNRLYRCETAHTSGATFDKSKFHVLGDFISAPIKVGDVGFVSWQYTLLDDHLALDGGIVSNFKATYPELYDFFDGNGVLTTTQTAYAANKALCYYDATNDEATMPDFLDKTVWGGTTIDEKQAGLPNITGGIEIYHSISGHAATITNGCVTTTRMGTNAAGATSSNDFLKSSIDASQSNSIYGNSTTVQPPAIQLIPQIRYRQEVVEGTVEHYDNAPIGTIISFMGVNAPNEFLICDGSTYNIDDYYELAEFIKSEFGTYNHFGGDGTTTFAVPDLRGEFLRGTGTNSHTNQGNGANVGVHQDATEQNIFVTSAIAGNELRIRGVNGSSYEQIDNTNRDSVITTTKQQTIKAQNTTAETVSADGYYTTRPTNTSVLYCIKYTNSITANPSNHYSTEEKRIGTWIDGKPLYQITVHMTSPATVNTGTTYGYNLSALGLNVSNLDLKSMEGFLIGPAPTYHRRSINFSFGYGTNDVATYFHDNAIYVTVSHTAYLNCDMYVTLKYTK